MYTEGRPFTIKAVSHTYRRSRSLNLVCTNLHGRDLQLKDVAESQV